MYSGELEIKEREKVTGLHKGDCAFIRKDFSVQLIKQAFKGEQFKAIFLMFTDKFLRGFVSPDEPGYDKLISTIFDTMSAAAEMNAKGWLTPEEVHGYLRRITGREIDKSTTLLPPFYVDYGKNIRIGYGSIVGANSVVTHDVPPMTIVGGNPAKFIKKIEAGSKK